MRGVSFYDAPLLRSPETPAGDDDPRAQGPCDLFGRPLSNGPERSAFRRKSSVVNGWPIPARPRATGEQPTLYDFLSLDSAGNGQEPAEPETPSSLEAQPPAEAVESPEPTASPSEIPAIASGEKAKARDILAAIRVLKAVEQEGRPPTAEERQVLLRFAGFGPVALSIFPDPVSGRYKDAGWQALGEELITLLTREEYESAKRTTFNAFYTSPKVIAAMHAETWSCTNART